jgi:hypothetical protein
MLEHLNKTSATLSVQNLDTHAGLPANAAHVRLA